MTFAQMFSSPYITKIIIKALVVGILVSLCSALLGVSLVLKRYSMIGDGLSHVGFGALALATLFGVSSAYTLEFSIPIVIIAAFFLLRISDNGKIKGDAAVALVSTSAMAIGVLIYNFTSGMTTDICNNLFSSASIISITDKDLWLSVGLSAAVIILFVIFYNNIFAVTFDEGFSKATGSKPEIYKMLISILTAVTIVLGIRMMGAIMISSLIIFPALTSMRVCKRFLSVIICSAVTAVICFTVGFVLACRFSMQTGPCVVVANLAAFLIFSAIGFVKRRA